MICGNNSWIYSMAIDHSNNKESSSPFLMASSLSLSLSFARWHFSFSLTDSTGLHSSWFDYVYIDIISTLIPIHHSVTIIPIVINGGCFFYVYY
mmetsp:Transcript_23337/g.26031  ORF Transcript_23337/g.26031 Transcript_23337/m.26031 type:complete len:94 (-) Transcript_23337:192-473(-)